MKLNRVNIQFQPHLRCIHLQLKNLGQKCQEYQHHLLMHSEHFASIHELNLKQFYVKIVDSMDEFTKSERASGGFGSTGI